MPVDSLRHRVWRQLDVRAHPGEGISVANKLLIAAILLSVGSVVLATEPSIRARAPGLFLSVETFFGWIFIVEYILRVWSIGERREYAGLWGRVKYIFTPVAIVDLIAVAPFVILFLDLRLDGADFLVLRLLRLFRVLTLARGGPFTTAAREVWHSIAERRFELIFSTLMAFAMMIVSATLLYLAEKDVQPDAFGSIPRAMWWAIATLTTVGYGDVFPVTSVGKILGGLVALSGVGLVAMPAGIFAAALSAVHQEHRRHRLHDEATHGAADGERHPRGMD
ncbi:ion transporter [Nisaea acidiphila]|uniref:Ion transporter n=1 Tax=Nisaea acidiphila TaxID=1862145 RepID=A0A9J7AVV5_9PROT|nr:ion transporter [Nisaea acidiphila]UUX50412.1 ion transporter [Nisaea acidiphila]